MKIHFIGIGGIGTSSLAQFFLSEGHEISGSDATVSDTIEFLKKRGIPIMVGAPSSLPRGTELVIYSAAISPWSPERKAAQRAGVPEKSYAEALGDLTKKYFTVAVSGSHGKSTTTALIALMMVEAGFDPTVIIGTKLKEFSAQGAPSASGMRSALSGNNFRKGKSKYLVIEADEFNRSFHSYYPDVMLWTNIDKEHLDTYKTFAGVQAGFSTYLKNLKPNGVAIFNESDARMKKVSEKSEARILWYSVPEKPFKLGIAGTHNQWNAAGAALTARELGIKEEVITKVLKNFTGAWRRMEVLTSKCAAVLVSDYAHHPTEVTATLQAVHEKYPQKNIITVFQPHLTDRFVRLYGDFKKALSHEKNLILLPIYTVAGREAANTSKKTVASLAKDLGAIYAKDEQGLRELLRPILDDADSVILGMSAGSLDTELRKMID